MIADFLHYYAGYTLETVLTMYAVSFYALASAMYRLKGQSDYTAASRMFAARAGGEVLQNYLKDAEKRAGGNHALLQEVRALKGFK